VKGFTKSVSRAKERGRVGLFSYPVVPDRRHWICGCFVDFAPSGGTAQALGGQGDVKFYLLAVLFLVFDVELLFLYPWAIALKSPDGIPPAQSLPVLWVLLILLVTLGLAYLVALRKGVFEWRRK
jgi:hypothetical protein